MSLPVTGSSLDQDLVDVALTATTQQLSRPAIRAAIRAGAAHRNLSLPGAFAASAGGRPFVCLINCMTTGTDSGGNRGMPMGRFYAQRRSAEYGDHA